MFHKEKCGPSRKYYLAKDLIPEEEETRPKEVVASPPEKMPKKVKSKSNKGFQYNLKEEPWDIRDAVMNRKKNKAQNRCFYFFYKTLPGSGKPERFRRERDCDEFEFDL